MSVPHCRPPLEAPWTQIEPPPPRLLSAQNRRRPPAMLGRPSHGAPWCSTGTSWAGTRSAPAERLGWALLDDSPAASVPARLLRRPLVSSGPSTLPSRKPSRGEAAAAGGDGTVMSAPAAPPSDRPPAARIRPSLSRAAAFAALTVPSSSSSLKVSTFFRLPFSRTCSVLGSDFDSICLQVTIMVWWCPGCGGVLPWWCPQGLLWWC
jgi:hypothetical protein